MCPKHDATSSLWVVVIWSSCSMRMRMMLWLIEETPVSVEVIIEPRKEQETLSDPH